MKADRAFVAGIAGGAAMTALGWLGRITMGLPSNMEMMFGTMFGTMFGMREGPGAWLLGLAIHLIGSGLIALIYARVFEHVTHRAGWLIGTGIGFVHAVIAGVVMGFIPAMHALIPGQSHPLHPRRRGSGYGATVGLSRRSPFCSMIAPASGKMTRHDR